MVRIITDSSSLYTQEEASQAGFDSIPLCVSIGQQEGRDLLINMDEFYANISQGLIPMSSQPPLGDVLDAYNAYPDADIINISMADGLSGTYQTACSAREMVDHRERITVFNSRTLCGPHRYMVEKAQQMKLEGKSASQILQWLEHAAKQTESFLIPQDFAFLKRGGRLTALAAATGSVLRLKPVMTLTADGTRLDKFSVKRTMASAAESVIRHLKKKNVGRGHIFYVAHARAQEDAAKVRTLLEEAFAGAEIHLMELSPAFVTQGGPGCVAIQYIAK